MSLYATGYNGTVRDLASLQGWSQWQQLDAETQRRVLWIMDASIAAGLPLGIGSIWRSSQLQLRGFLARHTEVASGGCCSYNGKRYALKPSKAHMAPPGRSYHESTTRLDKALAIDFIGDLKFLREHAAEAGLVEFSKVNKEPWHGQPDDIPTSRSRYVLAQHDPLKPRSLPGLPAQPPATTRLFAPQPTIKQGKRNNRTEVRALQTVCNFWGWRDSMNRNLVVDGYYGTRSTEACIAMQEAVHVTMDGWYGPQTARALQAFLDRMVTL